MTGHIRRRGKKSWELKFDDGRDPTTGKRVIRYKSFRGSKREAELELARQVTSVAKGEYVAPDRVSVGEFIDRWQNDWAPTNVSPKTRERYQELLAHHVRPHLGAARLQRLRAADIARLYGTLQHAKNDGGAGLSPRTVGHVHRLLHRVLSHAVKWGIIQSNPAASVDPPPVPHSEIAILSADEIQTVLEALRERPIYLIALLAISTGMRRGELCGLRWKDIDLDARKVRVEQSIEQTNDGLRPKPPKTKAGRRTISVPASVATELQAYRRSKQQQRLALGGGRLPDDAPVFARIDGGPFPPDSLSQEWARLIRKMKLPRVTFHALRHTHASQLIANGMDVVTVSRRLGHGSPAITLSVYSHLWGNADEKAADIVEKTMAPLTKRDEA